MGQDVSRLVHELNNSLAIISLQVRLLSRGEAEPAETKAGLDIIQEQAKRMSQMVDDLRSSADPYQPRLQITDVNAVIRYAMEIQRPQLQMDGIVLVLHLEDGLPEIQADPYQLQQVFINFGNNARQAMLEAHGGGRLTVASRLVEAEGSGERFIRVEFTDTGPGIPDEVMAHLFEPSFTTKGDKGGMGLGLAISEHLVLRQGGRIWAENNAAGGATLTLELPVPCQVVSAAPEPLSLSAEGQADGSGQRVLIIDDDPTLAHALGDLLREEGFEASVSRDAGRALELLERMPPDLIISDLSMPQVDGRQFWRRLLERHPQLTGRVLYFTGDSNSQEARAFLQESGCNWLEKPVRAETLVHSIRVILGQASEPGMGTE